MINDIKDVYVLATQKPGRGFLAVNSRSVDPVMYDTCIPLCGIWRVTELTHLPSVSVAYMRQWIGSALIQVMVCRLSGANPLSKPMLGCCQLDILKWKFNQNSNFHSQKCIWKYRLRNGSHFVQEELITRVTLRGEPSCRKNRFLKIFNSLFVIHESNLYFYLSIIKAFFHQIQDKFFLIWIWIIKVIIHCDKSLKIKQLKSVHIN